MLCSPRAEFTDELRGVTVAGAEGSAHEKHNRKQRRPGDTAKSDVLHSSLLGAA